MIKLIRKNSLIVQGHTATKGQSLHFLDVSLVLFKNKQLETLILLHCCSLLHCLLISYSNSSEALCIWIFFSNTAFSPKLKIPSSGC